MGEKANSNENKVNTANHSHSHTHTHSHEHTKEVSNRLARAIGHLQKVKQMVENGDDCSDVLIQLAAVKSALNNTGKVILKTILTTALFTQLKRAIPLCLMNLTTLLTNS